MSSCKQDVVGFFEEPTTYKHDFTNYPPQKPREIMKPERRIDYFIPLPIQNPARLPRTLTSNDTLQQLDYKSRLPFDAMLRPKEIVGSDPKEPFCVKNIPDDGTEEVIKTRPRQYVSPGISLDNVDDRQTRKLMIDFTYMTTTGRASKEAWSEFRPNEKLCLPNTVFEKNVNPLALRSELPPNIPEDILNEAIKSNYSREPYNVDLTSKFWKDRRSVNSEKMTAELISKEEKEKVRNLIKDNKLRLPYDKMPLSYGGFRPRFAMNVPLEAKELSSLDPNLSVTKAIDARLAADPRS